MTFCKKLKFEDFIINSHLGETDDKIYSFFCFNVFVKHFSGKLIMFHFRLVF